MMGRRRGATLDAQPAVAGPEVDAAQDDAAEEGRAAAESQQASGPHAATETAAGPRGSRVAGRSVRRARRRRWLRWLLLAVLVGVTVWWIGWMSPFTRVRHVVVKAPEGISESVVRKASGIAATDHVPAVNADRVRANVLAAVPAVADVEVRRSLPSTVSLTVVPRQGFAVLPSQGGFVVIDAGGVPFDTVGKAGDLPVVDTSSDAGMQAAMAVLSSLPEHLRADVRAVEASTTNDVDLTLDGGSTVRWGSATQDQLKVQVLEGLREVKANHYDVSAPMMPTTS